MKNYQLLCALLALFMIASNSQGMLRRNPAIRTVSSASALRLSPRSYTNLNLPQLSPKKKDGVHPYEPIYKQKVSRIALDNIPLLVSTMNFSKEHYKELLDAQIVPTFTDRDCVARVYLKDEEPVGFITYSIQEPWHRLLLPYQPGPNAEIHHLAIDELHKRKGYASKLVRDALADCKAKSVNRVSLWTTGSGFDLEDFYKIWFRCGSCYQIT